MIWLDSSTPTNPPCTLQVVEVWRLLWFSSGPNETVLDISGVRQVEKHFDDATFEKSGVRQVEARPESIPSPQTVATG